MFDGSGLDMPSDLCDTFLAPDFVAGLPVHIDAGLYIGPGLFIICIDANLRDSFDTGLPIHIDAGLPSGGVLIDIDAGLLIHIFSELRETSRIRFRGHVFST